MIVKMNQVVNIGMMKMESHAIRLLAKTVKKETQP